MKLIRTLGKLCVLSLLLLLAGLAKGQEKEADDISTIVDSAYIDQNQLTVYASGAKKWNKDVRKLCQNNAKDGDAESILFLGSSSVRLWNEIHEDLAPYTAIRRGYGGAKFCDLALFAPTLIQDLEFRGAVIYVGNDLAGKPEDKEPTEIVRLAKLVLQAIRKQNPNAPVLLVSITATPSRFAHWSRIEAVNRELKTLSESMDRVYFLDTKHRYLDDRSQPRPELFVEDRLHQNSKGYDIWGELIRTKLDEIFARR